MTQPRITQRPIDTDLARLLVEHGSDPLLARLLAARGMGGVHELDCSQARLIPPTQLTNAETMAVQLADAIHAGRRMLIVADYDSDGATACAVGIRALRQMGAQVDYIVPNRFEYGYGLTPEIARLAAARNPDLLITVDNGIAAHAGIAEAKRLGMTVLVTDHHLPAETLPEAACIVNPNQPGCTFPSKSAAGVGVIFYVMLALRAELRRRGAFARRPEPNLGALLDLVALGTVADVVKLDYNNRILVQCGLQRIRQGRACAGINALIRVAGLPVERVCSQDLAFYLGPRLNAAGRLDDMSLGIECLITDDPRHALTLAQQLQAINNQRKEIESEMKDQAQAVLAGVKVEDSMTITLFDEGYHSGVIGIVASRIREQYNRPVIVFAEDQEGEIKGSGRSIPGFHLRDGLDLVTRLKPDLIRKFGGHAAAAGLTIGKSDLPAFQACFEEVGRRLITPAMLAKVLETDGSLSVAEMTLQNAQLLQQQVWGQGFAAPCFHDEFLVEHQRVMGGKHLRLKLLKDGQRFEAVLFFCADPLPERILAVYSLDSNYYNGSFSLQLKINHWQPA